VDVVQATVLYSKYFTHGDDFALKLR